MDSCDVCARPLPTSEAVYRLLSTGSGPEVVVAHSSCFRRAVAHAEASAEARARAAAAAAAGRAGRPTGRTKFDGGAFVRSRGQSPTERGEQ